MEERIIVVVVVVAQKHLDFGLQDTLQNHKKQKTRFQN